VYPAVRVQHVLGQILAVNAVDGVADVLAGGDDQRERYQQDDREAVVQAEHGAVDVDVRDLYEALQAAEYVQHLDSDRPTRRPRPPELIAPLRGSVFDLDVGFLYISRWRLRILDVPHQEAA